MGCCDSRSEPINNVNFEQKSPNRPKIKRPTKKRPPRKSSSALISEHETVSPQLTPDTFSSPGTFANREHIRFAIRRFKNDYSFIKNLNNGTSNKIKLVLDKRSGLRRIIKKIKNPSKIKGASEEAIIQELEKFTELDYPHIVKIYELVNYDDSFYILLEPLVGGTLSDKISKRYHSEEFIKSCIYIILATLIYCHKRGIVHRNIRPESILFDSIANDPLLKLTSFGLPWIPSKKMNSIEYVISIQLRYMAPELITGTLDKTASDIWSLGVMLHIMLTDRPPFWANKKQELLESINIGFQINNDSFLIYSNEVKDLLMKMLVADFNQRISAEDALNHPWFQSLKKFSPDTKLAQVNLSRLLKFQSRSKIEKLIFGYTAAHFSYSTDEKYCIELFKFLDSDYDGIISKQDLLNKIDLFENPVTAEESLKNFKDEAMSYSEFVAATMDWNSPEKIEKLKLAFEFIDFDKSGSLGSNEIKNCFPGINDEELFEFMKEVGTDENYNISFEDLKDYLIKKS